MPLFKFLHGEHLQMAKIPHGLWVYVRNLSSETTEESLADWFAERGLDIPATHIDCTEQRRDGNRSFVVCIPKQVTADLLQAYLRDEPLDGHPVRIHYTPPPYER